MGERESRHKSGPCRRALRSNAWFSNCFRVFKDRRSITALILSRHSTNSGVALQSSHAHQAFNINEVYRKAYIRSVTACRYQFRATVCLQHSVSIRAKKWMGKNMSPEKSFHVFAFTCFCPNQIVADSRDISNRDDRTNFVSKLGCSVCRRPGF